MIYLPLKTVIEKYLRPHGLPDELVREIACPRYQGPGEPTRSSKSPSLRDLSRSVALHLRR